MNHITIGDIVRGDREVFPPYLYEAYQSTRRRAPRLPLIEVPLTLSELTGPGPAISALTPEDADLTRNAGTGGEAIGQRIIVTGRVLDDREHRYPTPCWRSGRPTLLAATCTNAISGPVRSIPTSWAWVAVSPMKTGSIAS